MYNSTGASSFWSAGKKKALDLKALSGIMKAGLKAKESKVDGLMDVLREVGKCLIKLRNKPLPESTIAKIQDVTWISIFTRS